MTCFHVSAPLIVYSLNGGAMLRFSSHVDFAFVCVDVHACAQEICKGKYIFYFINNKLRECINIVIGTNLV